MKIIVFMKGRNNKYEATGEYLGDSFIVKAGSKISFEFAGYIKKGGKTTMSYRNNPYYVDKNGIVLNDCCFNSPSTAAQFVTGRSINGYECWKNKDKKSLKMCIKDRGDDDA